MQLNRKGASRTADIPAEVLAQLNAGTIESATLTECLAIDFSILIRHVLPQISEAAVQSLRQAEGYTQKMAIAGRLLLEQGGMNEFKNAIEHPSDTVRGWSAYMVSGMPDLTLTERFDLIRPLADDSHFGVREWAWLALRSHIAAQIHTALALLIPWTQEDSANLRRFATESTRPRGVWCTHIPELKATPELGLPLLEPLKADSSQYVQDSVANWLNDASKTCPNWVINLCDRWQSESNTPATTRVCQRSLRSLKK